MLLLTALTFCLHQNNRTGLGTNDSMCPLLIHVPNCCSIALCQYQYCSRPYQLQWPLSTHPIGYRILRVFKRQSVHHGTVAGETLSTMCAIMRANLVHPGIKMVHTGMVQSEAVQCTYMYTGWSYFVCDKVFFRYTRKILPFLNGKFISYRLDLSDRELLCPVILPQCPVSFLGGDRLQTSQ